MFVDTRLLKKKKKDLVAITCGLGKVRSTEIID